VHLQIDFTPAARPVVSRLSDLADPIDACGAMRRAIDELDHGMMLLSASARLIDGNAAARRLLARPGPLRLAGDHVWACEGWLQARWMAGLRDANLGLKRMMLLGDGPDELAIALSTIAPDAAAGSRPLVLAITSRPSNCGERTLDLFSRSAGLTPAEKQVLSVLAAGATAEEIAAHVHRTPATVRTHIRSILGKTGARSTRALLVRLSRLPPIVPRIDPRPAGHQPEGSALTST
jgi:DNA-binding CsgD family transcriptional regulator